MSQVLISLVIRIFCGGLICMVAILLAGDGPGREPVRLCCACVMILLIFSSLKGTKIGSIKLEEYRQSVQEYVDQATVSANASRQQAISETAAEHVKTRAREMGISGEIRVSCQFSLDKMAVEQITVALSESLDAQKKQLFCEQLAQDLGVKAEQIAVTGP